MRTSSSERLYFTSSTICLGAPIQVGLPPTGYVPVSKECLVPGNHSYLTSEWSSTWMQDSSVGKAHWQGGGYTVNCSLLTSELEAVLQPRILER